MNINTPLGNLEKPMQLRWCFTFLASLLFLDLYLLAIYEINLSSLSIEWIKENIDLAESYLLVLIFSLTFSVYIPGLRYAARFTAIPALRWVKYYIKENFFPNKKQSASIDFEYKKHIDISFLKRIGVYENNLSAYNYAMEKEKVINDIQFMQFICHTIIVLPITALFFSTDTQPSLLVVFFYWVKDLSGSNEFIYLVVVLSSFFILLFILNNAYRDDLYDRYIYLPNRNFESEKADYI